MMDDKLQKELREKAKGRQQFKHGEQVVYEWDQTLDEVNIYIKPPDFMLPKNKQAIQAQLQPGQPMPSFDIKITPKSLTVGIKGNPPFLNEALGGHCLHEESYWMLEDDELHIQLTKMKKGDMWMSACQGHQSLDPLMQEEVRKNILLERFQEENPGFDFSEAQMNGRVPDAREFLGGVKYN